MAHINEEFFYEWIFDGSVPSAAERSHLAECATCQKQWTAIQTLAKELQIAGASEPSAAALAHYVQLFAQIAQAPSLAQRISAFIVAQLRWDGRQQPAWQGVRNTQVASYRLLYATTQTEIELLVVPREGRFQIEGEVVTLDEPTTFLPARCDLQELTSAKIIDTTVCQPNGRFHLQPVPPGHYRLSFVPSTGSTILIEKLELQ